MSGELVKWRPPEPLEAKIERWRERTKALTRIPPPMPATLRSRSHVPANRPFATRAAMQWAPPPSPPPVTDETVLDFPRICAVTGKLWTARHRREPGEKHFHYLRSTVAESWQCVNGYTAESWRSCGWFIEGIELCPHCGAYTMDGAVGSVFCPGCRQRVCYGLTSQSGYFICQCGFRGQIVNGVPSKKKQSFW